MNKDKVYSFIATSTIVAGFLGFVYGFFRVIAYAFDIVHGSDAVIIGTIFATAILLVTMAYLSDLWESYGWFDWIDDSEEEES